jgi:outer membrane protein TolC
VLALPITGARQLAAQRADSLTFEDALAIARARSPVLAASGAGIRHAEAQEMVARAAGRPRLAASGAYIRFQDPPVLALGPAGSYAPFLTNGYLLQLGVMQPLYTGGRVGESVRAAEAATSAAEAQRAATEVELTAAVAHAHDNALLARALREVTEAGAKLLRDAVRVATEHYDAGTVSRLDVLRAETRLSAAEARVREAADAEQSALERLAVSIGLDPTEARPVRGDLVLDESITEAPPVLALADMDMEPPGVEALRRGAAAYEAQARAAAAVRRPALSLYASAITTRPELVTGRERWAAEWLAGLFVTWPFLDSGASSGESRAARAAAARTSAEADQAVLRAKVEARSHFRALERAARDAAAGQENVTRAERALEIAQDRYLDGIGIQLEVLEAEADLRSARSDLLRAVHAHRSALIELKRVAGLAADAPLTATHEGSER